MTQTSRCYLRSLNTADHRSASLPRHSFTPCFPQQYTCASSPYPPIHLNTNKDQAQQLRPYQSKWSNSPLPAIPRLSYRNQAVNSRCPTSCSKRRYRIHKQPRRFPRSQRSRRLSYLGFKRVERFLDSLVKQRDPLRSYLFFSVCA